jgi:hypothetical protein
MNARTLNAWADEFLGHESRETACPKFYSGFEPPEEYRYPDFSTDLNAVADLERKAIAAKGLDWYTAVIGSIVTHDATRVPAAWTTTQGLQHAITASSLQRLRAVHRLMTGTTEVAA